MSPGKGWIGPLSEAPDPVFAEKIMGDGLLLDPLVGEVRAPCRGVIVNVATTNHAITIRTSNNADILIHIGIDTVALDGEGFTVHVNEEEVVETGAKLVSYDLPLIAGRGKSLLTPIIVINSDDFEIVSRTNFGPVDAGDCILELRSISVAANLDVPNPTIDINVDTSSVTQNVHLPLAHGLHARPAARLVNIAKRYKSKIEIKANGKKVNATSPVSLMGLGTRLGDKVYVTATGEDAIDAVNAIISEIMNGLGEEPVTIANSQANLPTVDQETQIDSVKLDGSEILTGTTGASGLVFGEVIQLRRRVFDFPEAGEGVARERQELTKALENVRKNLNGEIARGKGSQKDILNAHLALLDDPVLVEGALDLIKLGKSAGFAWCSLSRDHAAALMDLGDERMAARADDLLDLETQILSVLSGQDDGIVQHIQKGAIVIAEALLPSQFIRLSAAKVGGICVATGGPTSHVSILAADMGVPAIVAVGPRVRSIPNGTNVILAADRGQIHVAPTCAQSAAIKKAITKRRQNQNKARKHASEPCYTVDKVHVEVFANLGASSEAANAVEQGAEGCGLLRSEFLFLGRSKPPSEDEQLAEYQKIADALDGRPLVVRTLDIGGDKQVPFVKFANEDNPALGLRGIRVSFARPDLLKTQFRALLRITSKGPVHIMLPMIISMDEIKKARVILEEAQDELGMKAKASLGIMIETPASAILADSLAQEADFFSIGTNDLTQYVLAMDRGNTELASQIDSMHPAVLRMIKMTTTAGEKNGKWVGVCGAMASDLVAVPILIGLGIRELSSTAARLPDVKSFIRTLNHSDCVAAATEALNKNSPSEVRDFVRAKWSILEEWI